MHKGIAASPGISIGRAHVLSKKSASIIRRNIEEEGVEEEAKRLAAAVEKTKSDIAIIKEKVIYDIGNKEAEIFNAYLLLLDDTGFTGKAANIIRKEKVNAEYALKKVQNDYTEFFSRISDSYLKEKARDINGLVEKLLNNLEAAAEGGENVRPGKYIIIAHDLSPADTADMDKERVLGFATETGGSASHTAIVARSLEIPAVVGVSNITSAVKDGDTVILDGEKGIVVVNPSEKALEAYKQARKKLIVKARALKRLKKLDAITPDGYRILLSANIEFPEEVGAVQESNADGVGLYRTEFIYINKMNLPSEEDQFVAYKSVVEKMAPKPVTLRTLDIGGDKFLPYFKISPEQNPYLGLRAIRLSMQNPNIFKLQLRAMLRASAFGNVKIMFPMITNLEEIDEAKKVLREVMEELARKKVAFDRDVKTGVMIEVPSAAIMSDEIAKKADFFSIGTNDLIQYTLAVDRGNEAVAGYYNPMNPAVLRLIKKTIESAHKNNIKVSVCGEMAGTPELAFILAGMGVDELSVSPASVLSVKRLIRSIDFKDALAAADEVLKLSTSDKIKEYITGRLIKIIYEK